MIYEVKNIAVSFEEEQRAAIYRELVKLGIPKEKVKEIKIQKKSLDSRQKKSIKFIYNIEIETDGKINTAKENIKELAHNEKAVRNIKKIDGNIVVVGAGPAGLFAALRLAEYGLRPILIERGKCVEERAKDVSLFWNKGILAGNSNIQFGEGGAGTFSDGKLTTRIKSEYIEKVFDGLVEAGASPEIKYDYKPHIGTDVLVKVVKNLREKIKSLGGTILFNTKLTDIIINNGIIEAIEINGTEKIEVSKLFMGIGHSARDTYRMLAGRGVFMERKDFAVGTRIEHTQETINKMQYGAQYDNPLLPKASYNYTYNFEDNGANRGVFSFCMCPGGIIINAASEHETSLVNGMSNSHRNGRYANSALVVQVGERDVGSGLFDGMVFQEKLEKKMYNIMGRYGAIYQNAFDFINGKKTKSEIGSSYMMELEPHDFNGYFPEFISNGIKKAFKGWENNKYFVSNEANLIGVETRTSAPVRIKRDEYGESVNTKNLYPIGEGAGYAGGIISAAVDGIKIADLAVTF